MKKLLLLAFTLGLSSATYAIPIPIEIPGTGDDIPKNGTGGTGGAAKANDDPSNFFRLVNVINAFNAANPSSPLPTPIFTGREDLGSATVGGTGLTGFDYAVIHYGVGNGGDTDMTGGGVEVFFLNGATSFTFPANGSGPNGFGGFSTLTLFEGTPRGVGVPDGGSTVLLVGVALSVFGLVRAKMT